MLACTALVGCSNEDEPVVNNGNQENGDKAYLAVNIVTTDVNSRAGGAEAYEDGTGNECSVGKARFYFFNADGSAYTNTTTATTANYYETDLNVTQYPQANDNEEYRSTAILVIGTKNGGETTAGAPNSIVAILNPETADLGTGPLTLNQLKTKTGDYRKFGDKQFLMTNSVYANEGETKMEVFIEPGNLATTSDEALKNPVTIHVERVAAKITYTAAGENGLYDTGIDVGNQDVYAKITGVAAAHENPVSNLIKVIEPTWTNESLGFGQYNWNNATNYRSYWATSVNPTTVVKEGTTAYNYENINSWKDANGHSYAYCLENTQGTKDADTQTEALFAAQLVKADGTTPFEIAEWMGKRYAGGETDLQTAMANYLKNFWYKKDDGTYETFLSTDLAYQTLAEKADLGIKTYEVKAVLSTNAKEYYTKNTDGTYAKDENNAKVIAEIAKFAPAKIWNDGMTYYFTPIEHLGIKGSTAEYGVVRNHVYKINVTSITGLGTPVYNPETDVPTVIPGSDETFVAAEVHVLAWRVVNQSVELGK